MPTLSWWEAVKRLVPVDTGQIHGPSRYFADSYLGAHWELRRAVASLVYVIKREACHDLALVRRRLRI